MCGISCFGPSSQCDLRAEQYAESDATTGHDNRFTSGARQIAHLELWAWAISGVKENAKSNRLRHALHQNEPPYDCPPKQPDEPLRALFIRFRSLEFIP